MNIKQEIKSSYIKYILIILLWVTVLIGIFVFANFISLGKEIIYWGILGLFIFTLWFFKLKSKPVLLFSFWLLIIAGFFATFKLTITAEMMMRISLIGWLIGFMQALFEYLYKRSS